MPDQSRSKKIVAVLSVAVIAVSAFGLLLWQWAAPGVIEEAFNGRSWPLVNKYVEIHKSIDPANRTLEYFLLNGRPVVTRLLGVLMLSQILLLMGMRLGTSSIRKFFSARTHPANLAIFRIVLFASILLYVNVPQIIEFSNFPSELRVAPFGLGWLLGILPIDPAWASVASGLSLLACGAALLGFWSRTSAALTTILGFYVLGIPQFFGKIDHYHHLLWFSALMAVSPCGDIFSLDAFLARRKNRNTDRPEPSVIYALPLRFVMLLMGIIYFFAGFWKFVIGGFGWATSDTMKYILYAQWFRLDWIPALRIDQFPLLYIGAGLGVMVFELTFIVLLFFPRLRTVAALGGVVFHLAVYFFAHINFWTLGLCYVVFIDFEPSIRRLKSLPSRTAETISSQHTSAIEKQTLKPILFVGVLLLFVNILCGLTLVDSWPFAVYPTFASVEEKYLQSLTIALVNPDGTQSEIIPYRDRSLQAEFHPSRMIGLFTQVLWATDSTEIRKRGEALMNLLSEKDVRLRKATSILLYKDVCSVVPEEQRDNPIRRNLLLRVR